MNNWKEYKLGEIAEILNNKRVPLSSQVRAKRKGNYPYYGASGIVDYIDDYIFDGEYVLISEDGENLRSRNTPIAFKATGKFWVNNHAHIVRGKTNYLNDWIIYYFQNLDINPYITGAVQPKLNKENLLSIPIRMPDFKTAQQIAEILSSLDDKIELNNRINAELERLAQALFKHWFIDFEFPDANGQPYKSSGGEMVSSELGEIPKGWEVKAIGELFDYVVGGDWGKDEPDEEHSDLNYVIRGTDIPNLKSGSKDSVPYRAIKSSKLKNRQLQANDLIIEISGGSKDQPTGRTLLITDEILKRLDYKAIPASFCRLIRPKKPFAHFLGVYLTKIYNEGKTWEYQNQSTGISNFQFKFFETNELLVLPLENTLIESFNKIVADIYNQMTSNENLYLIQLRDTLLPRLLSGELAVEGLN